MNLRIYFTIALLCIGFTAVAHGEVISQAYELTLAQFTAPATANAGIAFKECDECEVLRMRVTDATSYSINGNQVRLEKFRQALSQIRDREQASVTVLRHLESNTVVSIGVSN